MTNCVVIGCIIVMEVKATRRSTNNKPLHGFGFISYNLTTMRLVCHVLRLLRTLKIPVRVYEHVVFRLLSRVRKRRSNTWYVIYRVRCRRFCL